MKRGRDVLTESASHLLLSKLRYIQKKKGHLPEKQLKKLGRETGIAVTKIYEVATFYSLFDTEKKGKHIIRVCNSPSCRMGGSGDILEIFKSILQIDVGETTKNGKYTLETTSCIGCCDESPAALIKGKAYTLLNEEKIRKLL